ncbi:putative WD repeat-containing protein [Wickerhamomyces ciferrii]|uniref:WD repeat-containing protein n=1 Tax=Wickerhamomyces ciferrii (strain ATCC 14091 / BCRC 22168 / CBS 111 / JCM 3599 / NBRC 0793 / NRRL Y-1031 F-60-10) TaxID=1206466 RepID=K0KUA1_WICCF|nr:putative WD repeat-containing protein [Wickerhamomyces ciferrii]CCH45009.1 putative WD repeat-containing protein [Wickerhamomyces ciferrii]
MSLKTTYANTELTPFYVGGSLASLSSDGSILVSAVLEDVVITNLITNEVQEKLEGDGEIITSLAITPDGKYVCMISQSQQLKVYNLHESKFIKNLKLSSPVYVSDVDETSTLLALGGSDGVVQVFDIENGYITHSFKGHGSTISSLKFYGELNSSNWKLASGDTMGMIKIWDLVKRKQIVSLQEHNNAVRGLDFNNDGSIFISGGRDDVLLIWDTKYWKLRKTIPTRQQVETVGFINTQDGELCYTGGGDAIFKIWNPSTGELFTQSKKPIEELMIIGVLHTDNDVIYLVLSDQTLFEIDLSTLEQNEEIIISKKIAGNHGTIADMRYCGSNLNKLALATNSPGLRIIDPLGAPLEVEIIEGHSDLLNAIDVSSDGLWLATGSKDQEARLWKFSEDEEEWTCFAVFKGHVGGVSAVGLPRSETNGIAPSFLLTASNDLTIKKWKIPNPKNWNGEIHEVRASEYTRRAHEKDINSLDISPNDEFFSTASYDKTGKVWDLETGETIGVLKNHKRGLWDIKFCKYDKILATASGDKTIKIWSLTNFTCLKTLEGHTNSVQRVEFINDSKQLVSSGADGLIKIWDLSTGECIKTLDAHVNRIWALIVKNNGDEFISADADGVFQIWIDNSEELQAKEEEDNKLKIEQEQSLQNFINSKRWGEAFLLALTLDHPMRLYNVLRSSIAGNNSKGEFILGEELDQVIGTLNDEQIILLFKRIRTWNVNAKFFQVCQKLIKILLLKFSVERLIEIPGLVGLISSIIPYNERHYERIDGLVEQSFILDYSLEEMSKI